jgi:pimeloyl-ACP methyl ester carboxylesterase
MPALPDELLAGVDIPVLLLEGERSPRIFGVITDELAHILPDTRRQTISRAGHSMQMSNPEAFDGAVASFLHEIE